MFRDVTRNDKRTLTFGLTPSPEQPMTLKLSDGPHMRVDSVEAIAIRDDVRGDPWGYLQVEVWGPQLNRAGLPVAARARCRFGAGLVHTIDDVPAWLVTLINAAMAAEPAQTAPAPG